jgi:hypothetical protein
MGYITIRIEISDGITKSAHEITHYDEPDAATDIENVLAAAIDASPQPIDMHKLLVMMNHPLVRE